MNWLEAAAVVFGLLCVWFTIRQNIWCWPTGLVQVTLYIYIFYEVKLYSDLILQVIYVILQIYGWHNWLHGGKDHGKLEVSRLSTLRMILWMFVSIVGMSSWGWFMATYTDAALPFWDSFIASASLIAQWLMTRKKLESWIFWISVDVVAIGVYLYKYLYMTAGLYTVFLIMAIAGLFEWFKSFHSITKEAV
jgi:nicotinamide mononucleotide transporter